MSDASGSPDGGRPEVRESDGTRRVGESRLQAVRRRVEESGIGTVLGRMEDARHHPIVRRVMDSRLGAIVRRREFGVLFAFLVLFGMIGVTRPDIFFDWERMSDVTTTLLRQVAPFFIIGFGMTFLIIGGEFDLSVGSMYAVGGLTFGMLLTEYQLTVPPALGLVLLVGAVVGLTNGVVVTKVGVPSLIATIGMLSLLRGAALRLGDPSSRSVPDIDHIWLFGSDVTFAGVAINYQVFWALGLLIVLGYVLNRTRFGYHVYAAGDDEAAASMTGIDTDRVKIVNFVLTSMLAAFAGVLGISYLGSMWVSAGSEYELSIIAAVVIGGTNLFGGEGKLVGTFLGVLVIGVIPVLLQLNGLPPGYTELSTGAIIILAVVIDIALRR